MNKSFSWQSARAGMQTQPEELAVEPDMKRMKRDCRRTEGAGLWNFAKHSVPGLARLHGLLETFKPQSPSEHTPLLEPEPKKKKIDNRLMTHGVGMWNLAMLSVSVLAHLPGIRKDTLKPKPLPEHQLIHDESVPRGMKRDHTTMTQGDGIWNSAMHVVPSLAHLSNLAFRQDSLKAQPLPEQPLLLDEPVPIGMKRDRAIMIQGVGMSNFAVHNMPGLARLSGLEKEPPRPQPPRPSNPTPPEVIRTAPLPIRPIPRRPGDTYAP